MRIEQALYGSHDSGGYRFLAKSSGVPDAVLPALEALCTSFGDRPAGAACPRAMFAVPMDKKTIAVVDVVDVGRDDAGRGGAMAFRVLMVPTGVYRGLGGDPFVFSDAFPPDVAVRGELPSLGVPPVPPPRTTAALRAVIDTTPDRTAFLLGGAQILVDGGRLLLHRVAPDDKIVRDLLALLPTETRGDLKVATFAFANRYEFDILVMPPSAVAPAEGYRVEEEAGGYPAGNYEFSLQKAVEDGDETTLAGLLARRSSAGMFRLLLGLVVALAAAAFFLRPPVPQDKPTPKGAPSLALPAAADTPPLTDAERRSVAERLRPLGATVAENADEAAFVRSLADIDRRLAKPGARSLPSGTEDISKMGRARRAMRAMLWRHGHKDAAEAGLQAEEMADRLVEALGGGEGR